MTGLTIWQGTGTKADAQIQLTGNWIPSLRVDNCHFHCTYAIFIAQSGAYGVIDHNLLDMVGNRLYDAG